MQRPTILVSNDDGLRAPGLLALAQALTALADVVVVAPERNWSAVGHTKTMHKPLRAVEVSLGEGITAYQSSGSPSDCVALALLGLVRRPVDLVISGINDTANVGSDLLYSGTFAAAAEAVVAGTPAIAISLDAGQHMNYHAAARCAVRLARTVLAAPRLDGESPPLLLNVNVPDQPDAEPPPVEVTRLGTRIYQDALVERLDPRGRRYYWIGGDVPTGLAAQGTDLGALAAGHVSVTPIRLDLTDEARMEALREMLSGISDQRSGLSGQRSAVG
jgi:5'-nucleotidase